MGVGGWDRLYPCQPSRGTASWALGREGVWVTVVLWVCCGWCRNWGQDGAEASLLGLCGGVRSVRGCWVGVESVGWEVG